MNEEKQLNQKTGIRSLKKNDLERAAELWLACFPEDDRAFVEYYFARRTCPERMLGLFETEGEKEKLVSMLCFEKRLMYAENEKDAPENTVEVLFVAGVCTDPAKRRRGFIRRLFAELERRASEVGIGVFMLQPFDTAFYEKLGYRPFAKQRTVFAKERAAEAGFESAMPTAGKMLAVYSSAFAGRRGVLVRTPERFSAMLEEYSMPGAGAAAVQRGDEYAYALWYEAALPAVDEFVFTGEAARTALEAELTARIGKFCYPAPAERDEDGKVFNMIKVTDERFRFLERAGRPPFDFTRY